MTVEPAYQRGSLAFYLGNAVDVLRELPDGAANCCVTSPPYWGLRDYGIDPIACGGDENCEHEWGDAIEVNATNHVDKRRWNHARNGRGEEQPVEKRPGWKRQTIGQGSFCQKCGAWIGCLGLEPTPELYVSNMVEVFREVRRVLRDDGTLWLNLGDSYNAYNGNAGPGGGFSKGAACDTERPRLETGYGLRTKGLKPKDLVGIPWRVAFALQADGWWLRQDIIWHKPNPMPESVTDRCTKAHEYLFLLAKSERYFFDNDAISEPASPESDARYERGRSDDHKYADGGPGNQTIAKSLDHIKKSGNKAKSWGTNEAADRGEGDGEIETHRGIPWEGSTRNRRSVWTVTTKPFKGAHFATFPPALITPCILAGCPAGGVVLDPFLGSGTTALVAMNNGCGCIGIELNPDYMEIAKRRVRQGSLLSA